MVDYAGTHLAVNLITSFEGPYRQNARLCEGGRWEIGWGSTYKLDNTPVGPRDVCNSEEEAIALFLNCVSVQSEPVFNALENADIDLKQNQVDALISFTYNINSHKFVRSDTFEMLAAGARLEDVAQRFTMYTSAQSAGPSRTQRESGMFDDIIRFDGRRWRWIGGPPGSDPSTWNYCLYRQRMRGLLRRRIAEACVFLGYDWKEAAANDAVFMRTRRTWDARNNKWVDQIREATELKDALVVARQHPLRSAEKLVLQKAAYEPELNPFTYDELDLEPGYDDTDLNALEHKRQLDRIRAREREAVMRDVKPISPNSKYPHEVEYGVEDPHEVGSKPMHESSRYKGRVTASKGKEQVVYGTIGIGGAAAGLTFAERLADMISNYSLQTLLVLVGGVALGFAMVGLWRWWHGKNKAYQGEIEASQLLH